MSSLILLKEELILQLQKKIKKKDIPGEKIKQKYGFCSETHILPWLIVSKKVLKAHYRGKHQINPE